MPLFDYLCLDCGEISEILVSSSDEDIACKSCSSKNIKKMLSAHSSFSGKHGSGFPGLGDTTCCGSNPSSAGCAGPGSCCGKAA